MLAAREQAVLHCVRSYDEGIWSETRNSRSLTWVAVRAGGAIPPYQIYPSGAVYHTSCVAERLVTLSTDAAFCQQLTSILEFLAAQRTGKHSGKKSSEADVSAAQHQLAALLKEGDPANSERVLSLLEAPYGVADERSWRVPRVSAAF